MGLKECVIQFDNPHNTYYAGQTVNGRVLLTLDSPKKVRGVYIRFKGEASTKWTLEERHTNQQNETQNEYVEYTGEEEYFKIQYHLLGGSSGEEIEIPSGQQIYPFTCALPPTLPSSFEGTFGFVRYTVKVVLDRPWKFDQETKAAFTVLSHADLNANESLREPRRLTLEKFFCCCWCKSGPLTCVVSVPCRGYVPGQTIPLVLEVDNISNVEVVSVFLAFRKIVTYRSQLPNRDFKKDVIDLETLQVGPVPAHESKTWNQPMIIPPLPPSNLTNCSLIDLDYELYIEAKASGFHQNLNGKIPLTIGTIPLTGITGSPTAPPIEATNTTGTDNVGWNSGNLYPSVPTFAESQFGTANIRDSGDNEYTKINTSAYNPMYPVYNFGRT